MTTDASLALAVGRRIHPDTEWREEGGLVTYGPVSVAGGHAFRIYYDPLTGADAAEAEAWLVENSEGLDQYFSVADDGLTDEGPPANAYALPKVRALPDGLAWISGEGTTPAEARARIIAAWPGGEG